MRYFLLSLLLVSTVAWGQVSDFYIPIDQSEPALKIAVIQATASAALKDEASIRMLADLQAAKLALFELAERKATAGLDAFLNSLNERNLRISALNAQIFEYREGQARMNTIITSYQQLCGPLP